MKRFLSLFTLLWFTGASLIASDLTPNASDAAPTRAAGARQFIDVPYVTGGHERQRLDLYLPPEGATRPLIVWVHGGGWEGGNKRNCPAKAMVARGYAVASLGYRLSQHAIYPAQIEDCKAAIRFLRANAATYGIDPARIGVWGASAGGHLVALLGTTGKIRDFDKGEHLDQSSEVQCVIDWFGPTDFLNYGDPPWEEGSDSAHGLVAKLFGGPVSKRTELARRASPIYFVKPDAPPFLIMQGDKDALVPLQQSETFHAALKKAGVESSLKVFPGAGHGGPAFTSPDALRLMTEFFDQHLLKRTASAR
jgi:acetyl esterase/lipase